MSTDVIESVAVKCHTCSSLYYTKTPESGCEQCGSSDLEQISHYKATKLFNEATEKTMFALKD